MHGNPLSLEKKKCRFWPSSSPVEPLMLQQGLRWCRDCWARDHILSSKSLNRMPCEHLSLICFQSLQEGKGAAGGRTQSSFPFSNSCVFSWGDLIVWTENIVAKSVVILSEPFLCSGPYSDSLRFLLRTRCLVLLSMCLVTNRLWNFFFLMS